MEENKKQTVEMTAEEAEAFKQFQEKQAKEKAAKKRKEDREAYAQLVDSEIESAIPELRSLSEQMLAVKSKALDVLLDDGNAVIHCVTVVINAVVTKREAHLSV